MKRVSKLDSGLMDSWVKGERKVSTEMAMFYMNHYPERVTFNELMIFWKHSFLKGKNVKKTIKKVLKHLSAKDVDYKTLTEELDSCVYVYEFIIRNYQKEVDPMIIVRFIGDNLWKELSGNCSFDDRRIGNLARDFIFDLSPKRFDYDKLKDYLDNKTTGISRMFTEELLFRKFPKETGFNLIYDLYTRYKPYKETTKVRAARMLVDNFADKLSFLSFINILKMNDANLQYKAKKYLGEYFSSELGDFLKKCLSGINPTRYWDNPCSYFDYKDMMPLIKLVDSKNRNLWEIKILFMEKYHKSMSDELLILFSENEGQKVEEVARKILSKRTLAKEKKRKNSDRASKKNHFFRTVVSLFWR